MGLASALVVGAASGTGVFIAIRSARPRGLALAARRLASAGGGAAVGSPPPGPTHTASRLGPHGMGQHLASRLRLSRCSPAQARDLAVLGRDPIAHAGNKVTASLLLAGASMALFVGAAIVGIDVPSAALLPVVVGAAAVGYFVPDGRLRRDAQRRRVDAVAALSSYLDLVTVLLAGGAGMETALHAAAESGDGWTYEQLRAALMRARTTRQSVWSCYADLGRRIGVEELVELSASVQLAGQQGARIAQSLGTRAATLRAHVLAGIEAEAHAASERMGLPTVLMFLGFLVLLGYPAAQIILGSP